MKKIFFILLLPLSVLSQTLKSTGQFGFANTKVNGIKKIMLQRSSSIGMEHWIGNHLYLTISLGNAFIEFDIPDFIRRERLYYKQKFLFIQPGLKKYFPVSRKSFTAIEVGSASFYRYKMQVTDSLQTHNTNPKVLSIALGTTFSFITSVSSKWIFELGLSKQDDIITKRNYEKIKRSGASITLHRKI